jgi:flagellar hook-associated protein 1 FlgK
VLTQVNTAFSGTTSGIGSAISALFSDLSALSTDPSNSIARQTVLTDAGQVVAAFHQGAAVLSSAANSANQQVTSAVAQINSLTSQIAALNGQLASAASSGQDGGALQDQRDQLTTQLAALVGIASTQTESNPTLTTTNGSPLVVGKTAYALQVTTASDGTAHVVDAQGNDITSALSSGTLGGVITVRDSTLSQLSNQLDTFASQFATAINSAQAAGYDANGNQGAAMFSLPASSSAAAGIGVALSNGAGIALSSDGSVGSSGNLHALLGVQTNLLPSGQTPANSYASLVANVGAAGSQVSSELTAVTASLQQLTTQQGSESGVSIDEETTNLIRYQQAYTAAARVISTVNDLYTVLMNLSMGAN